MGSNPRRSSGGEGGEPHSGWGDRESGRSRGQPSSRPNSATQAPAGGSFQWRGRGLTVESGAEASSSSRMMGLDARSAAALREENQALREQVWSIGVECMCGMHLQLCDGACVNWQRQSGPCPLMMNPMLTTDNV